MPLGHPIGLKAKAFVLLMIFLGVTDRRVTRALAPLAIGLGLTLIHLISIPATNTSVNPEQRRPGLVRRRLGDITVVALLALAVDWRHFGGIDLSGVFGRAQKRGAVAFCRGGTA